MEKLSEMVKVGTWALTLTKCESGTLTPVFYYNHVDDIFERKFSMNCAYWVEKECVKKEKELKIYGLEMVKGTMDVPKEHLIDSIMKTFVELGLVQK
ncbi:hypothetical protein [Viridibacillus arvi]|uniref:hypothetical protein n=1 Tax=Viridibacillus arvi TaxID=263475 RepID=UPI003D047038